MKALNRLYEWMWHIGSIRESVNVPYKGKAYVYRYPSPGSIYEREIPEDYKTPFLESDYNVRQALPTANQRSVRSLSSSFCALKIDPLRKLELLGLLKEAEKNNAEKVADAKKKFKELYKYNVEEQGKPDQIPIVKMEGTSRKDIELAYQKKIMFELNERQYTYEDQEEYYENPDILEFNSLDLYDAPHLMQSRIENQYIMDSIIDARIAAEGGMITREGSANYWKALDDSNDIHNVEKVQSKIGDAQPTSFDLKNARIKFDFDQDGNVINVHRIPEK